MLRIHLLGTPEVEVDEQPVRLVRRKSRALLYYLAAHQKPLSRENLLATFWIDTPRPSAQQTLRTTLHSLRKALGPALLAEGETVALSPDTWVDARLFESALSQPAAGLADLNRALDLYRGDFLADFSLPGAQAFEDWALLERERYRRLAVRGLTALSEAYEARQDYTEAMTYLDRALVFNPLQEDLQRESIRLAYLAGDRPGAIRRYDQLRRLLDEELGVPPMPETRALYDAIINEKPVEYKERRKPGEGLALMAADPVRRRPKDESQGSPSSLQPAPASSELPFTGRAAEMKRLHDLAKTNKLVLIEGEAGIGKTRLAEEYIKSSSALALVGKARELERALPYQPVIEALRCLLKRPEWPALQAGLRLNLPAVWLDEITRLVPEMAPKAGEQPVRRAADESRLWEAVNRLLVALAGHSPVLLFLDDLHWADASTLALLGYLVRQTRSSQVGFLATAQPALASSSMSALLQALIREDRLARLQLSRLQPEDVLAVARSLSPQSSDPLAEWLRLNSEGNPYILYELVREARSSGILGLDGTFSLQALADEPLVPQTIYSLIQARLKRVDDAARRVLDAAVAAGREFEFEVVARAAGVSEMAALDALEMLSQAGLVHPLDGSRYTFDHSLIMEVAYREVGEARHRVLHRRVAEALEQTHEGRTGLVAGLLAWHFAEGNDLRRAAPYAYQAGRQAAGLAAWTEAVAFYEQALQGVADPLRIPLWMALGEAHYRAGHFAQASESFRDALQWARSHGKADQVDRIELALAESLLTQARFAEVVEIARGVLHRGRPESALQAQFLWGTALSLEGSDLDSAAEHLRLAEAISAAEGSLSDEALTNTANIKFELGSLLAQQGDLPGAVDFYLESLQAASQSQSETALARRILAYNNLGYHLLLLGDERAGEFARSGLELAEEKGYVGLLPYLLSTLGEIALAGKDLDGAEVYFSRGLEIAERLNMPERVAGLTANLGLVARERGQAPLAIYRLSKALGQADALGTRHLAAQIRLWLAPLLPAGEGRQRLAEARLIAESTGRKRLLEEARRLEGLLD